MQLHVRGSSLHPHLFIASATAERVAARCGVSAASLIALDTQLSKAALAVTSTCVRHRRPSVDAPYSFALGDERSRSRNFKLKTARHAHSISSARAAEMYSVCP